MSYQRIIFTKPNVAELLPYEIEDPAADQVQVAPERLISNDFKACGVQN